jgi:hypothetical protein
MHASLECSFSDTSATVRPDLVLSTIESDEKATLHVEAFNSVAQTEKIRARF